MTMFHKCLLVMSMFLAIFVSPTLGQDRSPLDRAAAAIVAGDYDAAITEYGTAANDPALLCEALDGLSQITIRAQRLDEAYTALTRQIEGCAVTPRMFIMRAHVLEQLNRPQEALSDYQQALTVGPTPLQSYVYERIAMLDTDNGVRSLRLATEAERAPEGRFRLREKLADLYLLLGNETLALAEYNTILSEMNAYIATLESIEAEFDKDGARRALLEFKAATLEINLQQFDQGYARLQRIISTYTETPAAFDALVKLVNSAQEVDIVTRTRINIANENYTPILGVVPDYVKTTNATIPALYLYMGIAYRETGAMEEALASLNTLYTNFPDDPLVAQGLLELAVVYITMGNNVKALETYLLLVNTFPQSEEAPQALLLAAELASESGSFEQALQLYDQLATAYPTSDQAKQGLFEAAMSLINTDPARASALFGRVGTAEGFLWQGKLLEDTDPAAAQTAWTQGAAVDPGTYFGMRNCALITNYDPFAQSGPIQQMSVTADEKAASVQWVAQTFGLGTVSADLSPELAADPLLQRALDLWAAGFWTEARAEFDTLHRLHRNDAAGLLQLAFYYDSIGIYRSSIFAALRLIVLSDAPLTSVPPVLVRLAYPIRYEDLIIQESESNGLDPLLVAGLMRQESSFDATNISAADARGLMQLIPSTAADVAQRLSWPDYTVDDLLLPRVNIAFGSYYLASMRDFQNGSIIAALLSYNAGPGAARSWMDQADGDMDWLHRIIAYDETRLYQEFLYENAIIYQQFYRSAVPGCMFGAAA